MYRNWRLKATIMSRSKVAARPVRKATTAYGENLSAPMAALPKTGARPRKNAEMSAALIPVSRPFCILTFLPDSLSNQNDADHNARRCYSAGSLLPFYQKFAQKIFIESVNGPLQGIRR